MIGWLMVFFQWRFFSKKHKHFLKLFNGFLFFQVRFTDEALTRYKLWSFPKQEEL
jgi:hypothetical protein